MITTNEDTEPTTPTPTPYPGARMVEEREEEPTATTAPVEVVPSSPITPASHPSGELQLAGTAESVQRWVEHAARFERAKTACQVMAGFELLEIKRTLGFVQGGRRGQKPNGSVIAPTWEAYVLDQCGVSPDTARNWMKMAEALKPRLRKLPGLAQLVREIIDVPLASLSEEKCRLLTDAVHKLTDGKTQLEFMFELGIAKRPQGSAGRGGGLGGGRHAQGHANGNAAAQIARDDWRGVAQKIQVARENFTLLEDAEIDALIAALDATLSAMRRWRQAPKSLRDGALLAEVGRILNG